MASPSMMKFATGNLEYFAKIGYQIVTSMAILLKRLKFLTFTVAGGLG